MRIFRFITTIISSILMTSCIINPNKISIAYPNWAEGIAVTHLAREILVEQGFQVELLNADIAPIFTSLARGKTDVFLDSWLPVTHKPYFEKYQGKFEILGQVFDSARTGFSKEHPFAAELLGNIHLTDRQISSLMSAIEQTRGTECEAVREWIKQNRALVDSWIPKDKETKMYKYDYRRLRV